MRPPPAPCCPCRGIPRRSNACTAWSAGVGIATCVRVLTHPAALRCPCQQLARPHASPPSPAPPLSAPTGLPDFTAGWWLPLYNVGRQMTLAVLICMIDICESISIAKALARVNKCDPGWPEAADLEAVGWGGARMPAMWPCLQRVVALMPPPPRPASLRGCQLPHLPAHRPPCASGLPLPHLCRYQLNATQELRGLGIANIAGAMFTCYTTTGSFSRSAVNNSVGWVGGWWWTAVHAMQYRCCCCCAPAQAGIESISHQPRIALLPHAPSRPAAPRRRWPTLPRASPS